LEDLIMLSFATAQPQQTPASAADRAAILTKAMLRAADILGLNARTLARVIGVSEPTLSRMKRGDVMLETGTKPFELAVLVVRLYRSLDAITGGDDAVTRSWMTGPNTALQGVPSTLITSVTGLVDVVSYLDANRAIV
jgi:Protein of unknown function (DUF2384)